MRHLITNNNKRLTKNRIVSNTRCDLLQRKIQTETILFDPKKLPTTKEATIQYTGN